MATTVRCSHGALYETVWWRWGSFRAIRLGRRRLQRCPVHHRWHLITQVDPTTLTDSERREAARHPAGRIP